ncbi:MAG: hypothetical protein IT449_01715 [Phycisphaerales bacterium]|nr:hypothetical protein [Phycisphaerales bacterium]
MRTCITHRHAPAATLTALLIMLGACQPGAKVVPASAKGPQGGEHVASAERTSQASAESMPPTARDNSSAESPTEASAAVAQADKVEGAEGKVEPAVPRDSPAPPPQPSAVDGGSKEPPSEAGVSKASESPAAEISPPNPKLGDSGADHQAPNPATQPSGAPLGGLQPPSIPAASVERTPIPSETVVSNPLLYDLHNNPSAQSQRGEPSIIDPMRPCVWVSLDGREGRMEPGRMQWLVEEPVSPRPTFTLRTVPQVLGEPLKLRLAVIRLEEMPNARGMKADEKWLYFLESKQDGKVKAGIPYPLCSSGDLLTYTDRASSDGRMVDAMPNLSPGTYELIGDFVGTQTHGEKTLAVTRFTVKGD